VGDADQSVYRFRGADIRNILEFEKVWPDARVILLEQNYRSTRTILDAANAVISHNSGRKPKNLWTEQTGGELLTRFVADNQDDEASFVSTEIGRLVDEGAGFSDAAVFYRTNAQSRALEESLARYGVPYRVVGGLKFYERKEVKDVLAYLRVIVNPADTVSLKRVLNSPRRGIGETTERHLEVWADSHRVQFAQALDAAAQDEVESISARGAGAIKGFLSLLDGLREDLANTGLGHLVQAVGERTGYVAELQAEGTIEARGRLENIQELVSAAQSYQASHDGLGAEEALSGFLEGLALVTDADEIDQTAGAVTLMTLHNAKGLEFPAVFMVGMEDGVFPHLRSLGNPEELEEERRLCYVGITRAQQRLYLTHAWSRSLYGGTHHNLPSRFLKEIPGVLMQDAAVESSASRPPAGVTARSSNGRTAWADRSLRAVTSRLEVEVGDRVVHDRHGRGTVIEVSGTGERAEALVSFAEDHPPRRLLLAWAPLRRAEG
jgi:DNA helicase-2/ATP-dependent DNA helicase PcrA